MPVIEQAHIRTMMPYRVDPRQRLSAAHFLSPGFEANQKKKKMHRINSFTEVAHVHGRTQSEADRDDISTDDTPSPRSKLKESRRKNNKRGELGEVKITFRNRPRIPSRGAPLEAFPR